MTTPSGIPSNDTIDSDPDDETLALGLVSSCREVMVGFANLDPRLPVVPFGGQPPWRP
jgi:hypothetical protein